MNIRDENGVSFENMMYSGQTGRGLSYFQKVQIEKRGRRTKDIKNRK